MLAHGLSIGVALTLSSAVRWALAWPHIAAGGYIVIDYVGVLLDGVGPALALGCGIALCARRRGP